MNGKKVMKQIKHKLMKNPYERYDEILFRFDFTLTDWLRNLSSVYWHKIKTTGFQIRNAHEDSQI